MKHYTQPNLIRQLGSNQYLTRYTLLERKRGFWDKPLNSLSILPVIFLIGLFFNNQEFIADKLNIHPPIVEAHEEENEFISPLPTMSARGIAKSTVSDLTPTLTPLPSPTPSELENIVAYITRKFEAEGNHAVIQAINCFYSESGLRQNAVGQNNDEVRSKDHGVAQLNDYWHTLTHEEKTEYKANIDRAFKIYKGRGGNFSAWYGKRCN